MVKSHLFRIKLSSNQRICEVPNLPLFTNSNPNRLNLFSTFCDTPSLLWHRTTKRYRRSTQRLLCLFDCLFFLCLSLNDFKHHGPATTDCYWTWSGHQSTARATDYQGHCFTSNTRRNAVLCCGGAGRWIRLVPSEFEWVKHMLWIVIKALLKYMILFLIDILECSDFCKKKKSNMRKAVRHKRRI